MMLIINSSARGYAELPKCHRHLRLERWKSFYCRGTVESERMHESSTKITARRIVANCTLFRTA